VARTNKHFYAFETPENSQKDTFFEPESDSETEIEDIEPESDSETEIEDDDTITIPKPVSEGDVPTEKSQLYWDRPTTRRKTIRPDLANRVLAALGGKPRGFWDSPMTDMKFVVIEFCCPKLQCLKSWILRNNMVIFLLGQIQLNGMLRPRQKEMF
jgi:hypothetical protein